MVKSHERKRCHGEDAHLAEGAAWQLETCRGDEGIDNGIAAKARGNIRLLCKKDKNFRA